MESRRRFTTAAQKDTAPQRRSKRKEENHG
nr:MAG TPA: hypothetical protein [Bacteriophage sp.]